MTRVGIYLLVLLIFFADGDGARAAEAGAGRAGEPVADADRPKEAPLTGDPFAPATRPADSALIGDPFAESDVFQDQRVAAVPENTQNTFLQKGWLESRNQFWLRNKRPFSTRQRVWLEGSSALNFGAPAEETAPGIASARFFLSGSLDSDPAAADLSDDHDTVSAILHEAYLTVEGTSADVFIGKKMVRWGTGDGVNPLDLINPQDHRDPLASGRGDNRLAVLLVQGIVSLPAPAPIQELSLEAVAVPLATITALAAAGSAFEPAALREIRAAEQQGVLHLVKPEKPERWFADGKYGLRLTATAAGWDLGLAGYFGVKNTPVFTGEVDADHRLRLRPVHPRIRAVGVSFAKGIHRTTLRGELAIKPRYPLQKAATGLPGYSRRTRIEGVVGVDRTFGLSRYLNLQYFAEAIPENDGVTGRRYSHGLTVACSDLFLNDDVKLGVSGVAGFSGQGCVVQPYGEYYMGDNWLLAVSFFLFYGDETERYGQFAEQDFISLRLRYSF
ncbi:MAG: hypothetical protein CSA22_06620 [Deltaproteobacteria bacterium]|nr:MAG: hypothetical protein CSA22_06620 [Deltaproteobacteria bacterium]